MPFFNNKRKDFSIQPPKQSIANGAFTVTDSANIDFTYASDNLSANLTLTGITAGTYGDATHIPVLTLDIYGRVIGVSTVVITATGILLETNGVTNPTQTILNLIAGTNMVITDDGLGNITFDASGGGGLGTVTSVDLTMPPAFSVTGNPITTAGTLAVAAAGLSTQYIRGDGQLANFPTSTGGGSSVSYYLNGSINQGTFGGSTYYQMSKTPILGGGTTFTRLNSAGNGLIAQFITDAGDPNLLSIPGGNWNLELFFRASSGGGSPSYYVELYKYDTIGLTFTLIATDVLTPEGITNGTVLDAYFTALAVPTTTLASTDRLALRVFVNTSGRTIELHTENGHLCQIITTFSTGLTALNGLTDQVQFLAVGTSGTDFTINSTAATHTFNIPDSSALNRGLLLAADWSTFNGKQDALTDTKSVKIVTNNVELDGDNAAPGNNKVYGTDGSGVKGWQNAGGGGVSTGAIVFQFDGAGGVIPLGQYGGYYVLPYNFQITSWRLLSTTRGTTTALNASIVVDTYSAAAFPNTTSIWGGSKPTLTTASSATATGLSINLTAGNLIGFNVDSSTLGQLITLTLIGTKS